MQVSQPPRELAVTLPSLEPVHGTLLTFSAGVVQEGKPRQQCYTPQVLQQIAADNWNFAAPGDESQKQLEDRVVSPRVVGWTPLTKCAMHIDGWCSGEQQLPIIEVWLQRKHTMLCLVHPTALSPPSVANLDPNENGSMHRQSTCGVCCRCSTCKVQCCPA